MKKLILLAIAIIFTSCIHPVLNKNEYKVVDTLKINYSNFGRIYCYDVIVKYDSTYHYGVIDTEGNLTEMNPRNIKTERIKK